jgi:dTDP-glucose 4,6-dehydratase
MDRHRPDGAPHARLVTFVTDRPGHDWRYAIDAAKMMRELQWRPIESFETGIAKTLEWLVQKQS